MDFIDLARETKVMLATIYRVGVGFSKRVVPANVEQARTLPHEELSTIYYYTLTIHYYVTTIAYYKRAEKILCKTFGEYLSLFLKLANLRYQNR